MWKSNVLRLVLSDMIVAERGEQKMYGTGQLFTQDAECPQHCSYRRNLYIASTVRLNADCEVSE